MRTLPTKSAPPGSVGLRQRMLALALILAACGTTPPPAAPPEPAPTAAALAEPAATEVPAEPKRLGPVPPATPMPGAIPIALVGYGLRLKLNPPFQLGRLGTMIDTAGDAAVASWWDVKAEHAGKSGIIGLYNTAIRPRTTSPDAEWTTEKKVDRGEEITILRRGEGGTEVQLPNGHDALGGAGTLEVGPTHEHWAIEAGGREVPWPDRTMVHSTDPATGPGFEFLKNPRQPWGPWAP